MFIDTHIWIWWVNRDLQFKPNCVAALMAAQITGIEVSILSCWEVAKLVKNLRLTLTVLVLEWLNMALSYPGIRLRPLTPRYCGGTDPASRRVPQRPRKPDDSGARPGL